MNAYRPRLLHLTTIDLSLRVLLGHQLVRFAQEGYTVYGASAPGPDVKELERAGIRHLPVPRLTRSWNPGKDVLAEKDLVELFRRVRPDIVHTHNPKSGVLGRMAAQIARVPVIVNTVHGLYANPSMPPMRRFMVSNAERWAARLSDHEFFQSAEDHAMAIRTHMVRPDRASVLGNGVDLTRFDPDGVAQEDVEALRASWGVGPDDLVVGTVGRLVREKGYAEFAEAASEARRRSPQLRFVAVGSAEPGKEDGLSAADLASAGRHGVHFAGAGTDMPVTYAAFDMFVLASYREGMPRSAIEASAMRRAVVATDIRGCREVVDDGVTGVLVPVRDAAALCHAIMDLAADPSRRDAMGAAGRTRAIEHFDEERVISSTLAIYERLLGRARRGRRNA